jgi:malate dehydrogenase
LVTGVVATSKEAEAFKGVDVAILIGGLPRKEGMKRKDLIAKNVPIYKYQASALQQHAAPNCKVEQQHSTVTHIAELSKYV